ncbi:Serine protease AprX [subsurface metagenome]
MLNPYLEQRLYSLPVQPVLVEIDPNQFAATLGQLTGLQLKVVSELPSFSFAAIAPVSPSAIKKINSLPGVKMVHANQIKTIFQLPTKADEWFPTSESRKMLEAEAAFREGYNGEAVKVGVCDTGVDATHPQLQGTEFYSRIMWPFREILDENGHGSHCASTVAGKLYNTPLGITVEGVSHSPMVSVKCLGRGIGTGFTSEIIEAMSTCYEKGAQVISMSLGSGECQGGCEVCPECRMVSSLTRQGIILVIAAGNSGPQENTIGCPGCSPDALTVAAVDRDGVIAPFSSRGGDKFPFKPDVAAPGVNIYSGTARASLIDIQEADAGIGFAAISGTSMATPHVAGFVALLKQKFPRITTAEIKQTMAQRGHAKDFITGWGIPLWSYF